MSCHGNNATPPSPAIAPGADGIDPAPVAVEAARRGMDERVLAAVPGFDAPFFQAGLAGYSDAAMRIIARRHGCPFCVTEALLDRMLLGGGRGFAKADLELLRDNVPGGEEDHPLAGQLIGSEPDEMAAAAVKMIEQGSRGDWYYRGMAYAESPLLDPGTDPRMRDFPRPQSSTTENTEGTERRTGKENGFTAEEIPSPRPCLSRSSLSALCGENSSRPTFATIDVNLACPVKKVKNKARGGHWLGEPKGAIAILKEVRAAVPPEIPCTVKLRRGLDDTPEAARSFRQIFDAAYDLGYAWATVHARTVEQKYIGPSRWPALKELVESYPDRVIFGSGDVWEAADIFRMIAYTGVSGVAVARGCIGNPWIFRQARDMMAARPPSPPTIAEQRAVLEEHFRISVALHGENMGSRLMRKFGIRFAGHHPRGDEVRRRFIRVGSFEQWFDVLSEFYPDQPAAIGSRA